jgi:hypothetical protein
LSFRPVISIGLINICGTCAHRSSPFIKPYLFKLYNKRPSLKSPSFPGFPPFVQLLTRLNLPVGLDTVERKAVIVDMSPQAVDPRLEKTTGTRAPPSPSQTQKRNIKEVNEDNRQTHNIYHIKNCGTVYVDSLNAHDVRMENCGNNVPNVTCSFFPFLFRVPSPLFLSNLAISYHADHRPEIIGNEKVLHSQPLAVSNGMWTLAAPSAIEHVKYVFLLLDPQNATGSNPSDVQPQMNTLSPLRSPRPISQPHISGDHIHHNIKYLEQLLESTLATAAIIQYSGSPLPDVLTPRAYDALKALYALAAMDAPMSNTTPKESEIQTWHSIFSDIGNDRDCPYSSNRLTPFPNSSLVVPRTGRIHVNISVSMDYLMFFSWAGLAAFSCLVVVFSNLPRICLGFAK